MWEFMIESLTTAILVAAQACGGNLGTGILVFTILVRLALLPVTLRLARLSAAHREAIGKLKPELDRLQARFKNRPERLRRETRLLFEKKGITPFPVRGCLGILVQIPLFFALYSAVNRCVAAGGRFLWIGNIAKPDMILALCVSGIALVTSVLSRNPSDSSPGWLVVLPAVITFMVLIRMAAGIGLYWGASSLVGLLQAVILRRARLMPAPAGKT